MYFQKFPYMIYTLDDYVTGQLTKDIFRRVVALDELKSNYSAFDLYDIKEGETPEILADKIYGNSTLHWVILLTNDIIDPRFDWPLNYYNLFEYCKSKYHSIESKEIFLSGNTVASESTDVISFIKTLSVNNEIVISGSVNTGNNGTYQVSSIASSKTSFTVTNNGASVTFTNEAKNSYIRLFSDHLGQIHHYEDSKGNIVYSSGTGVTSVSNFEYEEQLNESKRRIKILKRNFISSIEQELEQVLRP